MHLRTAFVATLLGAMLAGCHSEPENVPLTDQKIYFSDKFYDVKSLSGERALIVGYGGKILETTDSGASLLYGRPRPTQDLNGAFGRRDGFLIRFLSEEPAADPNQGQAEFDQHG